jgi:hypothetical protein
VQLVAVALTCASRPYIPDAHGVPWREKKKMATTKEKKTFINEDEEKKTAMEKKTKRAKGNCSFK